MERIDLLRENVSRLGESDQAFAQSLLQQAHTRGLSAQQNFWVAKLVERATAEKPVRIDVMALVTFIAASKLRRPQIIVAVGGQDVRLSVAGAGSRTPGLINVTSTERVYEERQFFGRIGPDGFFDPSLSLDAGQTAAITKALQEFAADPAGIAARFGHARGECCFCALPLSDAKSLAAGYGKICARKYGLPYGSNLRSEAA